MGRRLKQATASALSALALAGSANADNITNVYLTLVPVDTNLNQLSTIYVDPSNPDTLVNVAVFARGAAGMDSSTIMNTFTYRYRDPDKTDTNHTVDIVSNTSGTQFTKGVFYGFTMAAGSDSPSTINAGLSQFQTDGDPSYGPQPGTFTNLFGELVSLIVLDFHNNLTQGYTTNFGSFTQAGWVDQNSKQRAVIFSPDAGANVVFVPEFGPGVYVALGGGLLATSRRRTKGRNTLDNKVDRVAGGKGPDPRYSAYYGLPLWRRGRGRMVI